MRPRDVLVVENDVGWFTASYDVSCLVEGYSFDTTDAASDN
jgi:hypothetical protein